MTSLQTSLQTFVDLRYKKDLGHISYASLVTMETKETSHVDLTVSTYRIGHIYFEDIKISQISTS